MKRFIALTIAIVGVLGATASLPAQEQSFRQLLDQLLPGMGAAAIPERQIPQQKFQDACFQLCTPGKEARRAEACKLIAAKLGPETPKPARIWLLKQLEFIGRAECVDVVAGLLDDVDAEIFDWARRALENNPAPQANAALLAKLAKAADAKRCLALVSSLGARGDQASVDAVAKVLFDKDLAVVAAAANALGKIGGEKATAALEAARAKAPAALRSPMADACLRCADGLLARGKAEQAAVIYAKLAVSEEPRPIRLAALQGQLHARGEQAAGLIVKLLASPDADARAIAAGHLCKVAGAGAIATFAAEFPQVPPVGQVLLLGGLAARGDKAAMPVAVAATKSQDLQVKLAGYRALGKLGDVSVVPMLIEAVLAGGDASGPARESLQVVFGPGADEAVIAALKDKEANARGTLIEVLGARRTSAAAPVLLEQARDAAPAVRSRAVRALGDVAEPKHVPGMIALLLKSKKGGDRDELESAITLVAKRVPEKDKRVEALLAALAGASDAHRCLLLPVLGRIGGKAAAEAIRSAAKSASADVQDAAIRALCHWPDASVADELVRIVKESPQESHRLLALRAYIRVIGLDLTRPPEKTLALFQNAMQMASQDEEKRMILGRVSVARCMETVRWVLPYLDNESLAKDASQSVVDLAHRYELITPNRAEFMTALKKVTEVCKDQGLVDRAKRIMEGP